MFEQLYKSSVAIARHKSAPYAQLRSQYLEYCRQRGDVLSVILTKASDLVWIAQKLSTYHDLCLTNDDISALIDESPKKDAGSSTHNLDSPKTRKRLIETTRSWLRYLGYFREPIEEIPFQSQLEKYCDWIRSERGLRETSISSLRYRIKQFLQWYGHFERPLSDIQIADCDQYLAYGHERGWCRTSIRGVTYALRGFFRHGIEQGWCSLNLPVTINTPRIYAQENLPSGPSWTDVQRLFAELDLSCPQDIRARAVLMLFAVYGLRVSEVAKLCLDDIDWENDQLKVLRAKQRKLQTYPLIPSIGNAILQYLQHVRHSSAHREIFLTLISPYNPLSTGGLFNIVSTRLKSLDVPCSHHGPHALRHACACRLLAEGLSLKEIGDHLGHRNPSATQIYAKVDLSALREVASFDLGELS